MTDTARRIEGGVEIDFHVHSHYSLDSLLKPISIIKVAKERGLSGVAVVDHNTVRGGIETLKLAENDKDFIVIVGAEIATDIGDVIGIFLKQEIKSRNFAEVVREIRQQDGIVILPHPARTFYALDKLEKVVDSIDLVEGFNARVKSDAMNLKAREFALRAGKPITGGSDAHFAGEIGNGRTLVANIPLDQNAIRAALLAGKSQVSGCVLPFPLYTLYELGFGQVLRFIRSRTR